MASLKFEISKSIQPKDYDVTVSGASINSEVQDIQSEFDPSTNYRFTATEDGEYHVTASCYLYSTIVASAQYQIQIYVNGSAVRANAFVGVGNVGFNASITDILTLSATDYVEIYMTIPSTGNTVKIYSLNKFSRLEIRKI